MSSTPLVIRSTQTPVPPSAALTLPSLLGVDFEATVSVSTAPDTISDLRLDAVIDAMAPGGFQRAAWLLPTDDPLIVADRQAVFRDVRRPRIRGAADHYAAAVADVGEAIADARTSHYRRPGQVRLLAALRGFAVAIQGFADVLNSQEPSSGGLRGVADALGRHILGEEFGIFAGESAALLDELQAIPVELGIAGDTVWAEGDGGRPPWNDRLAELFGRLDGAVVAPRDRPLERARRYLNHVEAQAVDLVAQLHPVLFGRLDAFIGSHGDAVNPQFVRLADELQFFLGALSVVDRTTARGVQWCLPTVTAAPGVIDVTGMVDLALTLTAGDGPPVPNDLRLDAAQRVIFVTGPNQGGKTTLARAVGQLAYLASLGLPVPAASARIPLHHPVLTHFPRPDDPARQRGGLAEELARLRIVLDEASGPALVILNELLSTTSADDAVRVAKLVLDRFAACGCRVLWVTFLDDVVTGTTNAVSLVGQVEPDDPTAPTFRFLEQAPAGRSHAAVLAARFGLSAGELARRLR